MKVEVCLPQLFEEQLRRFVLCDVLRHENGLANVDAVADTLDRQPSILQEKACDLE